MGWQDTPNETRVGWGSGKRKGWKRPQRPPFGKPVKLPEKYLSPSLEKVHPSRRHLLKPKGG